MTNHAEEVNLRPKEKGIGRYLMEMIICVAVIGALGYLLIEMHKPDYPKIIMQTTGSTAEQAEETWTILLQCGIKDFQSIERDISLEISMANTGIEIYQIGLSDENLAPVILFYRQDKTLYSVRYAGDILYQNQRQYADISKYIITAEERKAFKTDCENRIKERLDQPNTAKFPADSEWKIIKNPSATVIQSYVNYPDKAGVNVKSEFLFVVDSKTQIFRYLFFEGKEYSL